MPRPGDPELDKKIIKLALQEDHEPFGDLSSLFLLNQNDSCEAKIIAKSAGIMACSHVVEMVLDEYQNTLDRFLVSNPSVVYNTQVIPGISRDGHHAVYVALTCRTKKP